METFIPDCALDLYAVNAWCFVMNQEEGTKKKAAHSRLYMDTINFVSLLSLTFIFIIYVMKLLTRMHF